MHCMVIFTKTTRKYMCHACTKNNFADYNDIQENIEEVMKKENLTMQYR